MEGSWVNFQKKKLIQVFKQPQHRKEKSDTHPPTTKKF